MKKFAYSLILTVCSTVALSATVAYEHVLHEEIPLDGEWEMAYQPWEYSREVHAVPSFRGVTVARAIPGYWEDMIGDFRAAGMKDEFRLHPLYEKQTFPISGWAQDTTLPNIYGCFFYRRTVSLDRVPCDAVLAFEGVRNQVHVWVNGHFVAFRQGFSTPFELRVGRDVLRTGANEIILAVSNNPNLGYCDFVTGLTTRSTFNGTGGVNGHLALRFPKNDLADVYVTTAKDLKTFTVHVCGKTPFDYEIVEEVKSKSEKVKSESESEKVKSKSESEKVKSESEEVKSESEEVKSEDDGSAIRNSSFVIRHSNVRGKAMGDVTLSTEGFAFWSPENPKRYLLRIKTAQGMYEQKFGIRRLTADGEAFRLNGQPYYLRGVTEHCYFPTTVHLPRDIGYYRMITAKRKELGFNFVRFHTFVPPVEYFEAMDELGMVAHVESPNFVPEPEYAAIIAFARRHPSVVIYCTGNETRIDRLSERYLEDVAGLVHTMSDSLFSPMSAMRGIEYALHPACDRTVPTPFAHNAERISRMAKYCDVWTSYQLGATSYDSLNGASAETLDKWGDAYCGKPRTSHEICIDGSYVDLGLEALYPKDSPFVKAGIFSGLREQFARRGMLDKADLYFRNSCAWMRRIRKHAFEKLRLSRRTMGYDFLGDINTHWHTFGYSVGMMDEFYRLKPGETVENVRRYNSAAVLLTDLGSDFVVTAGERKRVDFTLSNFARDVAAAKLTVELANTDGTVVWSGVAHVGDVANGSIVPIGVACIDVPKREKPVKYLLRAKLGEFCANEWELYAFPKVEEVKSEDDSSAIRNSSFVIRHSNVRVVTDISKDDLLAAMAKGERVLLLGAGPFKSLPSTYRIGMAGRCSGNFATVIKNHPALGDFPHEGWCDWAFRRLMEGGRAVQLEAGVPFDPIIDVASSVKLVIRQSFLFEYAVGRGRLLVCSFKFGEDDPAAVWLRNRLCDYAASDAFAPAQTLTPEQLSAVIDAPLLSGSKNLNTAQNLNDSSSDVRAGEFAQP